MNDAEGVVYALSCVCHAERGLRYVGKTIKTATDRFKQHAYDANHDPKYPVHHWINKHGSENISLEVLEQSSDPKLLLRLECEWISLLRDEGFDLLNLTDGGEGHSGFKQSTETKMLRASKLKGRKISEEHRARISRANKGRVPSQETRDKWSDVRTGKLRSEEWHARARAGEFNHRKGENVASAKLCNEDIPQIVDLMTSGVVTQRWVASRYGVDKTVIQRIMNGTSWTSITGFGRTS